MNRILNNQRGMALLMVMTAITLLAFLLADFTFESKINKTKASNELDRLQARLNAEAGLKFALARLKLYKEGRNLLEKNENAKQIISPGQIESVLIQPFVYPVPLPKTANIIQRNALKEFEENMLLKGELRVTIKPVSGFLNPNNLIVPTKTSNEEGSTDSTQEEDVSKTPQALIEAKLLETLTNAITKKREDDSLFDARYGNIDPVLLIKEIKFYVNRPNAVEEPEIAEVEARYRAKEITPKHGPLSSIDELYLLDGWDDAIVDLIKDQLTVHEPGIIAVNELDEKGLRVLFPDITDLQVEEFFRHRDGDHELKMEPQEFKSEEDFKSLIIGKLGIMSDSAYTERMKEFEKAGLKVGVAGKLYYVESVGVYGRANINLRAYIDLPILPPPPKKKKEEGTQPPNPNPSDDSFSDEDSQDDIPSDSPQDEKEDEKKTPLELMEPRIREIIY